MSTPSDIQYIIQQEKIRELGGKENYDQYMEILKSKSYQQQQTFLIQQKHHIFFPDQETHLSGSIDTE